MTALSDLLSTFQQTAHTEREKGAYFERLVKVYLQHEPYYADLYAGRVWLWSEWRLEAAQRGLGDVGTEIQDAAAGHERLVPAHARIVQQAAP